MDKEIQSNKIPVFEEIKEVDGQGEYWRARRLAEILEYKDYRNFKVVMKKAWDACKNSGQFGRDHFGKLTTMVKIGSNTDKAVEDVRLSRYACYLIVQNASPDKEVVAVGQTYFAVQTRLQEIRQLDAFAELKSEEEKRIFLRNELSQHNKQLASTVKNAGVIDPVDYAIFTNYGYRGLYGGLDKKGIQKKKGLAEKDNILNHMGSTELAANLFRATQAEEKIKREKIKNKKDANDAHFEVGKKVRDAIKQINGTMPEDLPVEEDVKKLESRLMKEQKKLK